MLKLRIFPLRQLRRLSSDYRNREVLTDFHYTPFDDDNQGPRTSLSRLNDEMLQCQQIGIGSISKYGFRLYDGQFLYGPIAIFPKAVLSWRVLTPDDITPDSLLFFTMLEPKLEVLVIGAGDRQHVDPVRRRVIPFLSKHKIGLEIMHSEEAAMMFNLLNIEYRCVAAALYPPDELLVTTNDHSRLMKMYGNVLDGTFKSEDERLELAKKALRKYLPRKDAKRLDELESSRFLLPKNTFNDDSGSAK
ncbi:unnamed protein product [Thelazia callipaeda]|uniref:NADH dehydrogenase [ubiquinone] 1 alpha subcomplex assembly factor 3 n=1 Tax=Thelazia callipaeda TaxID=103827 RepID=A0A0N5CMJ4_THECL|nr:unnamed protein product [Thelazia callipaeda]